MKDVFAKFVIVCHWFAPSLCVTLLRRDSEHSSRQPGLSSLVHRGQRPVHPTDGASLLNNKENSNNSNNLPPNEKENTNNSIKPNEDPNTSASHSKDNCSTDGDIELGAGQDSTSASNADASNADSQADCCPICMEPFKFVNPPPEGAPSLTTREAAVKLISRNAPVQLTCGHFVCHNCLETWVGTFYHRRNAVASETRLEDRPVPTCPKCRAQSIILGEKPDEAIRECYFGSRERLRQLARKNLPWYSPTRLLDALLARWYICFIISACSFGFAAICAIILWLDWSFNQ
jgi:hypothetical protein